MFRIPLNDKEKKCIEERTQQNIDAGFIVHSDDDVAEEITKISGIQRHRATVNSYTWRMGLRSKKTKELRIKGKLDKIMREVLIENGFPHGTILRPDYKGGKQHDQI